MNRWEKCCRYDDLEREYLTLERNNEYKQRRRTIDLDGIQRNKARQAEIITEAKPLYEELKWELRDEIALASAIIERARADYINCLCWMWKRGLDISDYESNEELIQNLRYKSGNAYQLEECLNKRRVYEDFKSVEDFVLGVNPKGWFGLLTIVVDKELSPPEILKAWEHDARIYYKGINPNWSRGQKLSQDKIDQIRELYKQGMPRKEICTVVGVSSGAVSSYTKGIYREPIPRKPPNHTSDEDIAKIRELRSKGMKLTEIVEATGFAYGTVQKYARRRK